MATAERKLPAGWRWVSLGDVLRLRNDIVHPGDQLKGKGRFVGLEHIEKGTGRRIGEAELDLGALTGRKPRFRRGDIVYGYLRPYLNKVWVAEFDGFCSVDQYAYVPSSDVETEFIAAFMRSPAFLSSAPVDASELQLPRIRQDEIAAVHLALPPVREQKRASEALRRQLAATERARAAARAQLDAAEALAAAQLRAVFESEAAQGWPTAPLNRVAELLPANSIASDGDVDVRVVTTGCLSEFGFRPEGVKPGKMRSGDAARARLSAGELLIARSNTPELVGRAAVYQGEPENVVSGDLTIRVKPVRDVDVDFLGAYFSALFVSGHWIERAGGANPTMKKIRRSQLESEPVPIPHVGEQHRVLAGLRRQQAATASLVQLLSARLDDVTAMSAAILRQAFTGAL